MTYPDQSSPLTYTQGAAGHPLQLTGGGVYITANAHYTPSGDLCYRQDDWDGSWTTTKTFNNRLQPATIQSVQMFSGTPPPVCGISPIYSGGCCSSKLDLSYSFTDASGHNNDDVQRINNNLNMERTQVFSYDSLNRLSVAETLSNNEPWYQGDDNLANCWGEQYTYDPWGNFTAISPVSTAYTGCSQESLSMSPTTKNQLEDTNGDYVYDAAGNLTQPGLIGGPYVYDAENHLISADGVTYTYDGDGNRVMKSNGTIYWYGANDASLEESNLTGNVLRWYYFFDGQRVARQLTTNEVGFYMTDHLGNVRYLGGSATGYSFDYFPFGAPILDSDTGDDRYQFTGKERDSESGLDNFGARYDSSQYGRFMSPDPMGGKLADPQTLNKYSYVRNNPVTLTDPTGLYTINCTDDVKNCNKQEQNFDKALQNGLKSKDASVRDAAAAYGPLSKQAGDAGDNGVNVSLTKTVDAQHPDVTGQTTSQPGTGGLTYNAATNTFQQATQVTIKAGLGSDTLEETAVHEGVHVEDRAALVNSLGLDLKTGAITMNNSLNITARQSEINAYGVENIFLQSMGLPQRNVQDILLHPPYSDKPNINKPLFQALPGGPPR